MKTDLETLSKYESWFYSALNCDYIRALWKNDFEILVPIYEKWTGTKVTTNLSCGKCRLAFIQKLGKLYYKNKEEYESKSKCKCGETEREQHGRSESTVRQKNIRNSKTIGKGSKSKKDKN